MKMAHVVLCPTGKVWVNVFWDLIIYRVRQANQISTNSYFLGDVLQNTIFVKIAKKEEKKKITDKNFDEIEKVP